MGVLCVSCVTLGCDGRREEYVKVEQHMWRACVGCHLDAGNMVFQMLFAISVRRARSGRSWRRISPMFVWETTRSRTSGDHRTAHEQL